MHFRANILMGEAFSGGYLHRSGIFRVRWNHTHAHTLSELLNFGDLHLHTHIYTHTSPPPPSLSPPNTESWGVLAQLFAHVYGYKKGLCLSSPPPGPPEHLIFSLFLYRWFLGGAISIYTGLDGRATHCKGLIDELRFGEHWAPSSLSI